MKLKDLRILVVEDDLALLEITSLMLSSKVASVAEATNGLEALKHLESQPFDLVISDIQMPVMDGIEMLENIRVRNSDAPSVIFVTGQSIIDEEESRKRGALALIRKPARMAFILDAIQKELDGGRIERNGIA